MVPLSLLFRLCNKSNSTLLLYINITYVSTIEKAQKKRPLDI